jgi:HlyD family secretion protein
MAKWFKKKWTKWIVIFVGVVIVAGGGIAILKVTASTNSATTTTTFKKTTASNGTINEIVSSSGTVTDSTDYSLTSTNAGTIDSLPVNQGETVTSGETIAHINDPSTAQAVSQAQSALQSAEDNLSQSEDDLSSLYIKAPIDGRVKEIVASPGDSTSTDESINNGALAVISTERSMSVSFNSSINGLNVGEGVTVYDGNTPYVGTIESAGQNVTVTIGTDTPTVGDSVTIKNGNTVLGSGTLVLTKFVSISAGGSSGTGSGTDTGTGSDTDTGTGSGTGSGTGTGTGSISSSSGSNTITNVYVTENQMVSKDQNLFKLDGTAVEDDIAANQSVVTTAQDQLTAAQTAEGKDIITSPVNGVIAELDVKNGDALTAGSAVATIIDPDAMQTVVSIDELDIAKVQLGQQANVTLDAITNKTFTGEVTQIDPIGTSTNGVSDFNVTITIDYPTGVMVGMTSNADIITKSKDNAVVVTANAIFDKAGNTGYVIDARKVFDSSGKSIQLNNMSMNELIKKYGTKVTIGLANVDQDEITDGLQAGDLMAIPVTINKAALASLSNSQSTTTGFGGLSGLTGGYGGAGGGYTRRSGGTGDTVAGSSSGSTGTTSTTGSTGGYGGTGGNG